MPSKQITQAIPVPPTLPIMRNLLMIDKQKPVQSIVQIAKEWGPLFRLELPGNISFITVSSNALIEECMDSNRFEKILPRSLVSLRPLGGDGLFTAYNDEPNWSKAHRILMPAFSQEAMRRYHSMMLDISVQMTDRWARLASGQCIDIPEDMTRLTLDVIALCGFGYRLNSFYQNEMHPFIDSMVNALVEAMERNQRIPAVHQMMLHKHRQFEEDVKFMHGVVDEVIAHRKKEPVIDGKDLLSLMLSARDPETGETLDDVNIRYQIVTFLIAGHETTSALLSFTLHYLMEHPDVLEKAREEVDRVLGSPDRLPCFDDIKKLHYLEQVLSESLRLWPPAPGFFVGAKEPTLLDGRYLITPEDKVMINLSGLHRDPAVWGEDAERFEPERFTPEAIAKRPLHAWKPFGNGMRACIGRQFALHEAKLAVSMILQRFELFRGDPEYALSVRETLTFKPEQLTMRVKLRKGVSFSTLLYRGGEPVESETREATVGSDIESVSSDLEGTHQTPLLIGFGSNMGTTQAIAEKLAKDARSMGYAVELQPLDACIDRLSKKGAFLVVTASYNGFPPDNAARFCDWLDTLSTDALQDVSFSVMGCGHRDWAATYQAVPMQIDTALERAGGRRIASRGEADAREDLATDFRAWLEGFWEPLRLALDLSTEDTIISSHSNPFQVEWIESEQPRIVPVEAGFSTVIRNDELVDMTASFARSKRHIELELPAGMTYQTGDHLAVLPVNSSDIVHELAQCMGWDTEQVVVLRADVETSLPTQKPISIGSLLARYVELQEPIGKDEVKRLIPHTPCPPERVQLIKWTEDSKDAHAAFERDVLSRKLSLLDLLKKLPSCRPPLSVLLELLPILKPRYYSISSSPLWKEDICTLTVSVLQQPSLTGEGIFKGVCSNYLAECSEGDRILTWVRRPQPLFAPPKSISKPMILIGAGTGIAPFRGFLEERSHQSKKEDVACALLFFGCDHPDVDFVYKKSLQGWEEEGIVSVFPAFSVEPEGEMMFVQHRVWEERESIVQSLLQGAIVYICGDGRYMAPAVRDTLDKLCAESSEKTLVGGVEALRARGQFFEDVWVG